MPDHMPRLDRIEPGALIAAEAYPHIAHLIGRRHNAAELRR